MLQKIKAIIPISVKKPLKTMVLSIWKYLNGIPRLVYNLYRIKKIQLDHSLKKKIKKTVINTFYLRMIDKKNNTANITGNNIKFESFNRLYHLFEEIFITQPYYFRTENKKPLIIDCGSHIGMSVMYFKLLYPEAKIICFEPNKHAFQILLENIAANRLLNVDPHDEAVMNYNGKTDFYINEENKFDVAMSTIKERVKNGTQTSVKATTLSMFIEQNIDFLKMDIEGAELSVLQELKNSGKLKYIKQTAIEFHHHIIENDDNFSQALELLEGEGFGYQLEGYSPHPHSLNNYQDIMIFAYNKTLAW